MLFPSVSLEEVEEEVLGEIRKNMQRADEAQKSFILHSDLKRIVRRQTKHIFKLERWTVTEQEQVEAHCCQILGLLIWIGALKQVHSIRDIFFKGGSSIHGFPLIKDDDLHITDRSQLGFLPTVSLREGFIDQQYVLIPYTLRVPHPSATFIIPPDARLPFLAESRVGTGGYGIVSKVQVARDYLHGLVGNQDRNSVNSKFYAVKQITFAKDFTTELLNLNFLNETLEVHKHILTYYGSYTHGNTLNFLLPLAEYGDLEVFLNGGYDPASPENTTRYDFHEQFPYFDQKDVRRNYDLLDQTANLADAVMWMHSITPAMLNHMDLKPANILIRADVNPNAGRSSVGLWVISGFGLAVQKPRHTSFLKSTETLNHFSGGTSDVKRNNSVRPPGTYQAPEVELGGEAWMGSKSDIWSLGCIAAEVLAFALGNRRLVQGFRDMRIVQNGRDDFFYSPKPPALLSSIKPAAFTVNPAVIQWLEYESGVREEWAQCYVRVILGALEVDVMFRTHSGEFFHQLKHASEHCKHPDRYGDVKCIILRSTGRVAVPPPAGTQHIASRIQGSVNDDVSQGMSPLSMLSNSNTPVQPDSHSTSAILMQPSSAPSDSGYASELRTKVTAGILPNIVDGTVLDNSLPVKASRLDEADNALLSILEMEPSAEAPEENAQEPVLDVARTLYSVSNASSQLTPSDGALVNELAKTLLNEITSYTNDQSSLERLGRMLPDLLRAFALKLGSQTAAAPLYEIAAWVHKHRRRVQRAFEARLPSAPSDATSVPESVDFEKGEFAIGRFVQEAIEKVSLDEDAASPIIWDDENVLENLSDDDADEDLDHARYRDAILQSPAFAWLVASLRREAILKRPTPDIMNEFQLAISSHLPTLYKVSRKLPSEIHRAVFTVDWKPLIFVREQRYAASAATVLQRAITLTGTAADAQALTVEAYLIQTWPATGSHVARFLARATGGLPDPAHMVLPDGTKIKARLEKAEHVFVASIEGTTDSVVEFGQQLAWVGAALRSSHFGRGVASCTPFIDKIRTEPASPPYGVEVHCAIHFHVKAPETHGLPGRCWHQMFQNPVLVTGFPVLEKPLGIGIEMPLGMLPFFAGSDYMTHLNGHAVLKGFSTMLVTSAVMTNILVWHFHYRSDKQRISYPDTLTPGLEISYAHIQSSRHVVGWCTGCRYHVGDESANHDVKRSALPRPSAGMLLEKFSLSGAFFVGGGVTFAPGTRDFGPHLSRDGYFGTLKWMQSQYVIFWDENEARGWLVNGTSALLHLVRASLWEDSRDSFQKGFLFHPSQLSPVTHRYTPMAATEVLADRWNRKLRIQLDRIETFDEIETEEPGNVAPVGYSEDNRDKEPKRIPKEKETYYTFEDRVRRVAAVLDALIDHQQNIGGERGIKMKGRVRTHLEGWSFTDLISNRDLRPHVATLGLFAYSWVNLIRSLNVVTLFGRGYGELIEPDRTKFVCTKWSTLPNRHHYLAASTTDLKKMMEDEGTSTMNPNQQFYRVSSKDELLRTFYREKGHGPPQLVDGYLWHAPMDPFARCPCHEANMVKHHDPVQMVYPMSSRKIIPLRVTASLKGGGAVIFGQSAVFPYCLGPEGEDDLEYCNEEELQSQFLTAAEPSGSGLSTSRDARSTNDLSLPTPITPLESGGEHDHSEAKTRNDSSLDEGPPMEDGQQRLDIVGMPGAQDVRPRAGLRASSRFWRKLRVRLSLKPSGRDG